MAKQKLQIMIRTEIELSAVLEKLERQGYKWWSNGIKPTKFIPDNVYSITLYSDKTILFEDKSYHSKPICKCVTAKEFLKNECIVIYRNGNETIALDKLTGNKYTAKCQEFDEYDFLEGAEIAFARLVKDKTYKKCNEKIQFKPYIKKMDGEIYGLIGQETNIKDHYGNKLYVGDVVYIISKISGLFNVCPIVFPYNKAFAYGYECIFEKNGTIPCEFEIFLKTKYEDVKDGSRYSSGELEYVKEPRY